MMIHGEANSKPSFFADLVGRYSPVRKLPKTSTFASGHRSSTTAFTLAMTPRR